MAYEFSFQMKYLHAYFNQILTSFLTKSISLLRAYPTISTIQFPIINLMIEFQESINIKVQESNNYRSSRINLLSKFKNQKIIKV